MRFIVEKRDGRFAVRDVDHGGTVVFSHCIEKKAEDAAHVAEQISDGAGWNLDREPVSWLIAFSGIASLWPRELMRIAYGRLDDDSAKVSLDLASYARLKIDAIRAREDGCTTHAYRLDEACESKYNSLPEWARW